MEELTRQEWATLFNRALPVVGSRRAREWAGGAAPDEGEIARWLRDHDSRARTAYMADLRLIARRAIRAVEAAEAQTASGANPINRGDIPFNRGLYASQSEYQYVVIVGTVAGGRSGAQGTRIVIGSNDRLGLTAIRRRALARFSAIPEVELQQYDASLRSSPEPAQLTVTLVAVSRFEEQ